MKVAIVYDRVNKWGGAERVLLDLNKIFPKADLFTSVYDKKKVPWAKVFRNVYTSFLQKIPFAKTNHEYFSVLMPLAFESFNFDNYDLVISITSEFAKSILTSPKTKHISIILTPTRYLWSGEDQYFRNKIIKFIAWPLIYYLKYVDKISSRRPDTLIAISREVQDRIKKYYELESDLVYPAIKKLNNNSVKESDKSYYLIVSRLVSYKKVDLVVKAFNKLGKNLFVIGIGREENYLKSIAQKNVKFLGKVSDEELVKHYKNAKALIFPQEEDFGLVPIEAQRFGTPVIAFGKGGALETVIDGKTGIFFDSQDENSIIEAIKQFESMTFSRKVIINNSMRFSFDNFKTNLLKIINEQL